MSDNSDSEYDSEDDEDYVPEEPSSEEDACVETDKKKQGKRLTGRGRRKGGIKLDGDEDGDNDDEVSNPEDDDNVAGCANDTKEDLASKQRVEDLWAAFKQDTATAGPATSSNLKETPKRDADGIKQSEKSSTSSAEKKDVPKKVEVTEVFDFAGEEVKVVKSVDASSIKPTANSGVDETTQKRKPVVPLKRPGGGLGSVLGKIGKKPKLSTLEKSKLDWNSFKKDEGIEDELKSRNKDGYLEKQAFLNRVDHNQFEIERDIRQGARKR